MTTQDIINYYANLLIIEYISQPNAYATIQALVSLVIMSQLPTQVQNGFNLDGTAQGVQLDVLGEYNGVTRSGVNFANQMVTLDDADFLVLIKLAGVLNSAQSDLSDIEMLLNANFPGEIFVFDHKNMRMSYLINSSLGSQNLIQLFVTEGLLPKPMGVQLAAPIVAPALEFFGMLDALDVSTYASQNSVSITTASNAVATADNISPFNDAVTPITGVWLDAIQGV